MKLSNASVLLTGTAGGIGRAFATALHRQGARLLLTDTNEHALVQLASELGPSPEVKTVAANLADATDRSALISHAKSWRTNVLINNAGICRFGWLEEQTNGDIAATLDINAEAPIALCLGLLPHLQQRQEAHIVNLGSVFGSIGYPGYALYAASKFAVRGFSEALKRELADTGVRVHYLAPRATDTGINDDVVVNMNRELNVATDKPEVVAEALCQMLNHDKARRTIGFPEKLFVRLNGMLPELVDHELKKQLPTIKRYGRRLVGTDSLNNSHPVKEMAS